MSRILVLLPVALWFVWVDARAGDGRVEPLGVVLFLGGLALAVLVLAYAAGRAARREARGRSARQRVFRLARALVLPITLVWFGYALFFLGWGEAVRHLVERPTLPPLVAPGMFYGESGGTFVRVALTATDERIAAAARRLTRL